jgi:hypothetical protein
MPVVAPSAIPIKSTVEVRSFLVIAESFLFVSVTGV